MTSPAEDIDMKPEKMEEKKEGQTIHCDLYDMDLVRRIAQEFLPGLSAACVDNTTGGLFSSPSIVAVEIRKEMIDYLVQRSENYVAESVVLETGPNEEIAKEPYDIISDFIDDFASSKRNFFGKLSGWVMSESREDRIDDFVQEMDVNGFWQLNRRESIAQTLLKNVDFKNLYHCDKSFKTKNELEEHKSSCNFREMVCTNEGCNGRFSAIQMENHDSTCPFKILQCEQKCPEYLMRRDMDKHCITACPMKLVKCPFYAVGCQSSIPQTKVGNHRSDNLKSHVINILQVLHKEAAFEDLMVRADEIIEMAPPEQLAAAKDARTLTRAVKPLNEKLGPVENRAPKKAIVAAAATAGDGKEESKGSPTKEIRSGEESASSETTGNGKSEEPPTYVSEPPVQKTEESQMSVEEQKASDERVKSPPSLKDDSEKSIEEEKASGEQVVTSSPPANTEPEKSIEEEKASEERVTSPPAKDESEMSIEEGKASDDNVVKSPPAPLPVKDESEMSVEEEKASNAPPVTADQKDEDADAGAPSDELQSNNENSVADEESSKESPPEKEEANEVNSVAEVDKD